MATPGRVTGPPGKSEDGPASKDCQQCKRRRIHCDRAQPACGKCLKAKLHCPGYGLSLRWTNGVASRGRFKGMEVPVLNADTKKSSSSPNPNKVTEPSPKPASLAPPTQYPPSLSSIEAQLQPAITDLDTPIPELLGMFTAQQLLDHYANHIAGSQVWVDSPDNPYRKLIVPLARQRPVLLLAIMAIAAEHLSAQSEKYACLSKPAQSCRDAVIAMVTQRLRYATQQAAQGEDLSEHIDPISAESMLASMLLLCNYELVNPQSTAWQTHLQAARTLISTLATSYESHNELFTFLRNQFYIMHVFACTTTFQPLIPISTPFTGDGGASDIFLDYMKILDQVTIWERDLFEASLLRIHQPLHIQEHISIATLRDRFEQARGRTLALSGPLPFATAGARRDFTRLAEIYHEAGLLYAYRCLYSHRSMYIDVAYSSGRLFEVFSALEDKAACMQNLVWPLFIAGTESWGNLERQGVVLATMREAIEKMGFQNCEQALVFLRELWKGPEQNWLVLARQWEARGQRFLVV